MIDTALRTGIRGLPGGSSLLTFLNEHRGIFQGTSRCPRIIPESEQLRVEEIVRWGEAYRQRSGAWPNRHSGAVEERPGLTWLAVENALSRGLRDLPGGMSLSKLLRDRD